VNLQRFYDARRVCQFTEILLGFYGAPSMSIYRDFAQILLCLEYVFLQL